MKYRNVLATLSVVALSCVASKAIDYTCSDSDSWHGEVSKKHSLSKEFKIKDKDVSCAQFTISFDDWSRDCELLIGGKSYDVHDKTCSFELNDDLLLDLCKKGKLDYEVKVKHRTKKLNCHVKLDYCTPEPTPPHPVPDGGLTVTLLGLGLLAVGVLKRKLAA